MAIKKYELIIFDCDGVLVDSEIIANRVSAEMKQPYGINFTTKEHCIKFIGLANSHPEYQKLAKILPKNFEDEKIKVRDQAFKNELKPCLGVPELLESLDLKYCLASSGTFQKINMTTSITNIGKYFKNKIYSSQEVENGKPAPDIFLLAAKQEKIAPSKCLVIEDSVPGIQAAQSAGMDVFFYHGGSHMFDEIKEKCFSMNPTFESNNISEIRNIIKD